MQNELNDILEKLRQYKVALFIGAGVSKIAGLPLGGELADLIKSKFPKIEQNKTDFLDICEDVVDTPPYNITELYDFVRENLNNYNVSETHKKITAIDWTAIFTTNYDDVIENSYSTSGIKVKSIQPIYKKEISIDIHNNTKVYLYKVMGCVRQDLKDEGHMVLTRKDYLRAQNLRKEYLRLLLDYVKNGTMVFAGYSFNDLLVKDIIDQFMDIYGKDLLPWSYAIFPKPIPQDEKTQHFYNSRKIIPIHYPFEDFINYLFDNIKLKPSLVISSAVHHIKIKGVSIPLDNNIYNNACKEFDIITEDKVNEMNNDQDGFFKGTNEKWSAFKNNWDVERTIHNDEEIGLEYFVNEELKKFASEENNIVLIKGMAGTGKTMSLNRLAYNVYKRGDNPVISISSIATDIDYKVIATFIEYVNDEYLKIKDTQKHLPPLKFLITIDDAASYIRQLANLKDYLTSRGRSVLIVAAERNGEWQSKMQHYPIKLKKEFIFNIEEYIRETEIDALSSHFIKLGYLSIATKDMIYNIILENDYSFFASIYSLVYPAQIPLNQIIKNQYINLSEPSKKAFEIVCCFSKYNIPMNMELLVRTLHISYDYFIKDILESDALKVIFQENDEQGNVLYRAHHKIIAEKTLFHALPDSELLKDKYVEIFSAANLSNIIERKICEKIIIEYISTANSIFSYQQKRAIYEAITSENDTRSIIHHWGLLEMDNHHFEESERLLKRALDIPRDGYESFRGESDQNIKTTLGTLYSKIGVERLKELDIDSANQFFIKAEELFSSSKYGEYPNIHAYHSHANMYLRRANESKNNDKKLMYIAKAFEIINSAKDNCNDEEQLILELETDIWNIVGDQSKISESIESLRLKYNTPVGYFLSALFQYKESKKVTSYTEKEKFYQLALHKLEKGLKYFPNDESCLGLKCRIFHLIYPNDNVNYLDALRKWYNVHTTPNVYFYFELGKISFILGYFDMSEEIFYKLEKGIGEGHKLRSTPRDPISIDGTPKFFEGTISFIKNKYEGYISCNDIPNLNHWLPFRPIATNYTTSVDDLVKFNISFSFRGPRAENIIRI